MRTETLIETLVTEAGPVRPLAPAGRRLAVWLAAACAFLGAVVLVMSPRADLWLRLGEARFAVEQTTAFATAVAAGYAALVLSVPGRSARVALLPAVPAAIWLGGQGAGCLRALAAPGTPPVTGEPECLIYIALAGSLPAVLLVAMLRRGFAVRPRPTLGLAALAAAALGNVGLRFFHAQDAALMILVWQTGSVLLLALAGWAAGRRVLDVKEARR